MVEATTLDTVQKAAAKYAVEGVVSVLAKRLANANGVHVLRGASLQSELTVREADTRTNAKPTQAPVPTESAPSRSGDLASEGSATGSTNVSSRATTAVWPFCRAMSPAVLLFGTALKQQLHGTELAKVRRTVQR
jgi:hypothetical protein